MQNRGQVNEPDVSFKYPDLAYLRLSASRLEIMGRNGYVQRFRIVWIPTHFGKHRAILVCSSSGGGAIRLFGHYGNYACRFCHRAAYASQKNNQIGRKRLAASKLRLLQLGGWPDINEPMPSKPKWTRRKAYQHVRNEIQALEAKAKTRRFRKPIPHSSSPITSARTKSAGGLRDQLGNPGQDGRPAGPALQV
jgi:hypothetical protein